MGLNYSCSYLCSFCTIVKYFLCALLGDGMGELSLADRATIANMSPEYGATMGFFPVDHVTLQYLKLTGRSDETVSILIFLRVVIAILPFKAVDDFSINSGGNGRRLSSSK